MLTVIIQLIRTSIIQIVHLLIQLECLLFIKTLLLQRKNERKNIKKYQKELKQSRSQYLIEKVHNEIAAHHALELLNRINAEEEYREATEKEIH